jgi:hypothetical protein
MLDLRQRRRFRDQLPARLERARRLALMATDTLSGVNRVGRIIDQYRAGLITETEALERL